MNKAITAVALAGALLAGGTTTATGLYKDVRLEVDGQVVPAGSFALTVADVLAARGIAVGENDLVTPALDATVSDGQTVSVRFNKQLTLRVDGRAHTFDTTAATLDAALAEAPVAELGSAWLSMSPSTPLPRDGLTVTVSTPKDVTFQLAGEATRVNTTAHTVADLLAQQGVVVGTTDRLRPAADAILAEGQKIVLDRVRVTTKTKTEKVGFKTVNRRNSALWKGESRLVTAGKPGKVRRTYEITVVNGEVTRRKVLKEVVVAKASAQVREIGTKTASNGVGINLARAAMWDRIARCESGGRWNINTGNGYYGGLQFALASWNSNGGRDFAAYPHHASRAEQITVANRYYAKAGTSPWSCA